MPGTELLDKFPQEIQRKKAQYLSTADLLKLSIASTKYRALYKPMADVRKLLGHIVRGEHDAVRTILNNDVSLMFKKDRITDCSGRTFEHISAFEYALWALDKHMWTMMLHCIPQNEEGKAVLAKLLSQYEKVITEGVTYRFHEETITEKHFDFANTIIKELQTQVDSTNVPGIKNWDAINKQWREGVGGAQKLLPMHVVYEYCSDKPFYPVPHFTSQPKSSKQFYNWLTRKHENWFSSNSKLGVDFAILKGLDSRQPAQGSRSVPYGRALLDLAAMRALYEIRTIDFINLKSQLEEQMTVDNQRQTFQI
ncbi:hypothetical protein [Legionella oakridgensis]|uniref:F-box domain-containing protein n=2 Tax=Legionella oakridgensis TaxID=29423 RepID=W0B8N1_9GAMM|nr:hypothetical protein [Legionella oakridgensis]AHE66225.1 hypothetical protein Loa_00656 [Legionella oakridgensis ATCC 33761 = DSM 21215]KTD44777.1 hypothetical protein Loak_0027 [Legionella oakridgensis]STY16128.1 SidC homolog [Legionella longbeachae]